MTSTASRAKGFSSESVGPTFGETVARSAAIAIVASLLLIMAYVALRFEPKFAIPVMIALFHDLLISVGVYSLTGREVTTSTVAAPDHPRIFALRRGDRVRPNTRERAAHAACGLLADREPRDERRPDPLAGDVVLDALCVAAIFLFGGETLKDFAFALLVGILSGTYSSIFIAARC